MSSTIVYVVAVAFGVLGLYELSNIARSLRGILQLANSVNDDLEQMRNSLHAVEGELSAVRVHVTPGSTF